MIYTIVARCENGHSQAIEVDGSLGVDWANGLAGLLDGSSPMYIHPPDPGSLSVVGRCGICRTQIKCVVTDSAPAPTHPEEKKRLLDALEAARENVAPTVKRLMESEQVGADVLSMQLDKPKATLSGNPPAEGMRDAGAPQPIDPETGQHKDYWVLPAEERARGFIRPYRDRYKHSKCGGVTTMGRALSETYARDPKYYGATFCAICKTHFPVSEFTWTADGEVVGS